MKIYQVDTSNMQQAITTTLVYEVPAIRTISEETILEALGPAHASVGCSIYTDPAEREACENA